MRRTSLVVLVAFFAACASRTAVAPLSVGAAARPATMSEAFHEVVHIAGGTTHRLSVVPGRFPQVSISGEQLLVVPIALDPSRKHTIVVSSYVTRAADGSHVLFYPLVSLIDSNFKLSETLKPKYQFEFAGARLRNEFSIPVGVSQAIIRTDPEYFRGDFVGASSTGTNLGGGAYGVAGAVGGVIGALLLQAATAGESKEFRFGEFGVLEVETR